MKLQEHSLCVNLKKIDTQGITIYPYTIGTIVAVSPDGYEATYEVEFHINQDNYIVTIPHDEVKPIQSVPEKVTNKSGSAFHALMWALEQPIGEAAIRQWTPENEAKCEVVFTCNGVQLSFVEMINHIFKIHDEEYGRMVNNAAVELLKNKGLDVIREKILKLEDNIDDIIKEIPKYKD